MGADKDFDREEDICPANSGASHELCDCDDDFELPAHCAFCCKYIIPRAVSEAKEGSHDVNR